MIQFPVLTSRFRGKLNATSRNPISCLLPQLALSPSPRTANEPIPVQNTQQLTLKVEGVIQHGSTRGLFRKIHSVCLNASSTLQSKATPDFKVGLKSQIMVISFSSILQSYTMEELLNVIRDESQFIILSR